MNLLGRLLGYRGKRSFSQSGEDLIVDFVLNDMGIQQPTYLDIGANDPVVLSNTYYFYRRGCTGVCVEPLPEQFRKLARKRTRDICLNAGIGTQEQKSTDFWVMAPDTLSTFSREEAERVHEEGGGKIEEVIQIPLVTVDQILSEHFREAPDLVSLDVEGTEYEILTHFDFSRVRPKVFCVETVIYSTKRTCEKVNPVADLMTENGYFLYADTFINSIFVDRASWCAAS